MQIDAAGNVGIGTTAPAAKLQVNGSVAATFYVTTSDARLKHRVRAIEDAMEVVRDLRGVTYEWDPETFPGDLPASEAGRQVGFLAQEVRAVLPEVVREAEDGRLSVAYANLVPVLVEALQEQDAELERLRARVSTGDTRLAALEHRLSSLEAVAR